MKKISIDLDIISSCGDTSASILLEIIKNQIEEYEKNKDLSKLKDDKYWVRLTAQEIVEILPFFKSLRKVNYAIGKLKNANLIEIYVEKDFCSTTRSFTLTNKAWKLYYPNDNFSNNDNFPKEESKLVPDRIEQASEHSIKKSEINHKLEERCDLETLNKKDAKRRDKVIKKLKKQLSYDYLVASINDGTTDLDRFLIEDIFEVLVDICCSQDKSVMISHKEIFLKTIRKKIGNLNLHSFSDIVGRLQSVPDTIYHFKSYIIKVLDNCALPKRPLLKLAKDRIEVFIKSHADKNVVSEMEKLQLLYQVSRSDEKFDEYSRLKISRDYHLFQQEHYGQIFAI